MAIEKIRQIAGRALPLRGDNIDTDRIIPARFLRVGHVRRARAAPVRGRSQAARGRRAAPSARPTRPTPGASMLLVNANFGCGSSREHAPQAIRRSGIRAVVGESFSEIFFGNSVALGMPCVTADAATSSALMALVEREPRDRGRRRSRRDDASRWRAPRYRDRRFRRARASRSSKARGTRPGCCSIGSRRSRRSRRGCRTSTGWS